MLRLRSKILPLALSALFAATTASSIVATQAAHPATPGAANGIFADTASPANAQGYLHHREGRYRWHGRYWEHRTWHRGYWGEGHRWHRGVWVYF